MADDEITITGNGYEITAYETIMGDWCVYGTIGDADIDSEWTGVQLDTFDELDDMIHGIICDELA